MIEQKEVKGSNTKASSKIRELRVDKLKTLAKYQNRKYASSGLAFDEREMKKHVKDLAKQISDDGLQVPIEVYGIDGEYCVVNGHHRLAAVKSLNMEKVRCRVTKGSKEEAWKAAMEANKQASAPLKSAQRTEVAWAALVDIDHDYYRRRLLNREMPNREFARLWSIDESTIRKKMIPALKVLAAMSLKLDEDSDVSEAQLSKAWLGSNKHPLSGSNRRYVRWGEARQLVQGNTDISDSQLFEFKKSKTLEAVVSAILDAAPDIDQPVLKAVVEQLEVLAKSEDFMMRLADAREEAQETQRAYEKPEYEDEDEDF